jgi:hypothetical protein
MQADHQRAVIIKASREIRDIEIVGRNGVLSNAAHE